MKVLALTHGPTVGPGVFGAEVAAAGHELEVLRVQGGLPDGAGADAVLVFGGAVHPDQEDRHPWLLDEHRFLVDALERDVPLFGVCLGAQLIAKAAGASVHPASAPEIGWTPVELTPAAADDPVFGPAPARFDAFEWHHYTYDVPAGAVELARSASCTQAFRLGRAVGIQFHAEVTAPQVAEWAGRDEVRDPDALRAATRERIAGWNAFGRDLCRRFLETV